jgi:hypothetical protein
MLLEFIQFRFISFISCSGKWTYDQSYNGNKDLFNYMVSICIQDMIADYINFLYKHLVRVLNRHYGRSAKGILSELNRRFSHTRVSSNIHLAPAIRGIKLWVLDCTQQDLPVRRKEKTLRICKAIWLVGLLHLQEALLNMHPYIQFLLVVIISSVTNHSL